MKTILTATAEHIGSRIDAFVASSLEGVTRSAAARLLDDLRRIRELEGVSLRAIF